MDDPEIKDKNESQSMNGIYRFFCWCSGARLYILKQCPSEYNKFFGIGAIVTMTGIMATLTGAYALFTVFKNPVAAIILGLLWGILIFFLDWYIVSSLKKEKKVGREWLAAAPRLILAVLIAFVISKPLELKLFEKEIHKEIALLNQQKELDYQQKVHQKFSRIEGLKKENQEFRRAIKEKEKERKKLFDMIIAEAEGRSPTQLAGKGPVYKEKRAEFDRVDQGYRELRKRNLQAIERNNKMIAELREKRNKQIYNSENSVFLHHGFLGQLKGLNSLASDDPAVRYANWFIVLLFIVIESAPMIVKLMSGRGPYDALLEAFETEKDLHTQTYLSGTKVQAENTRKLNIEKYNTIHREGLETEKLLIGEIYRVKQQTDQEKVERWKAESLKDLEENPEAAIASIQQYLSNGEESASG
jgi:hypothetical protein